MAKEKIFLAAAVAVIRELNKQRKITGNFRQEAKILQGLNRAAFFKGLLGLEKGVDMQKTFSDWKKYKSYRKENFKDLVGATLSEAKGMLGVVPASLNSFGRKSAEIAAAAGSLGLTGLQKTGQILAAPFVGAYLLGGKVSEAVKTAAGQVKTSAIKRFKQAKKGLAKKFNRFKNWVPNSSLGKKTRVGWEFTSAIARQTGKDLNTAKDAVGGLFGKAWSGIKKAAAAVKGHYAEELDVAKKNAAEINKVPVAKVTKLDKNVVPTEVVKRMRDARTSTSIGRANSVQRKAAAGIPVIRAASSKTPLVSKQKGVKNKKFIRPQHRK